VTKAFLPKMLENHTGHIVTISSAAGIVGAPGRRAHNYNNFHSSFSGLVDYSASKFAVFGFMEALQHELTDLGNHEISFTTVCPIYVRTSMINKLK
jgi:short-subunit dehydrogenase